MSSPVVIIVKSRGPYTVQGPVDLRDLDGNPIEPPLSKTPGVIKLCSCGQSRTKPFCDGTHKTIPVD